MSVIAVRCVFFLFFFCVCHCYLMYSIFVFCLLSLSVFVFVFVFIFCVRFCFRFVIRSLLCSFWCSFPSWRELRQASLMWLTSQFRNKLLVAPFSEKFFGQWTSKMRLHLCQLGNCSAFCNMARTIQIAK